MARLDQSGSEAEIKPLIETVDGKDLARQIQKELNRIGCAAGRPDGLWGKGSRKALKQYGLYGKIKLVSLDPSTKLLDQLKAKQSRICPLICPSGFENKNDNCVRVKQEAKLQLKDSLRKNKNAVTAKKQLQKKKTASAGNCPSNAYKASLSLWPRVHYLSGNPIVAMHGCGKRIRCTPDGNGLGARSCNWLR